MANLTFTQLENLWKQAGGNATAAAMAAAVAMAESGGNPQSTNSNKNGTIDRGLWQINSIHGSLSTFDPLSNAKSAVQISNNGSTWRPWCTAWSNGLCGGTYLGTGAPYKKFLTGTPAPNQGTDPPASGGSGAVLTSSITDAVSPKKWVDAFLVPLGMWFWYGAMTLGGFTMILIGLWLLVRESRGANMVGNWTGRVRQASEGTE